MSNSRWQIAAKTIGLQSRKILRPPVAAPMKAQRLVRAPIPVSANRQAWSAGRTSQSDKLSKPVWCPWPEKPEINQPTAIDLPTFGGENEEPGTVAPSIACPLGR